MDIVTIVGAFGVCATALIAAGVPIAIILSAIARR